MNTIRDIEKYVYNLFFSHFRIPPYFDSSRDFNKEKIFRQMIDIEYYLQKKMEINNLLLFNKRSFYSPFGYFQINFDNAKKKVSVQDLKGMSEPFCIDSVKFITVSQPLGNILYVSHIQAVRTLSLFPAYCLLKNFFTGNKLYDIEYDIKKGIEACHTHLGKDKIEAVSKNNLAYPFEIHFFKQHANEKSYMVLGCDLQDKLCRQYRTLLTKNGDPIKKIVIITDCLDIFIDRKNIQKDITYVSWDHPHVEIKELNWNILKGCHVFYILTEHSNRNLEDVYKTSVEVKKELDKVNIKSFRYVFLERHRNSAGQLTPIRLIPYIYSFEEYHYLKNPQTPPAMNLKLHKSQVIKTQESLLHPYFKTGTATLIYGNSEVNKTVFVLMIAHAMRLGQCAFKGWREGKEPSSGIYFFNNHGNNQTNTYFKHLKNVSEKIFLERNKYKNRLSGYIYPPDFKIFFENYDSLSNKADFIKKNIQALSSRKFIILENVYCDPNLLPEQNILVRELTDHGWCVIIVADFDQTPKKAKNTKTKNKKSKNSKTNLQLYLKKMTTIDNVLRLTPQRPSIFGNTRLKVEIKNSKIVPIKERKNIICELSLDIKHPTCNQISLVKRKKITPKERNKMKAFIKEAATHAKNVPDEKLAETKKMISDKAIAKKLEITTSMVKKLRREIGWQKNKRRFIKIDHERLIIR